MIEVDVMTEIVRFQRDTKRLPNAVIVNENDWTALAGVRPLRPDAVVMYQGYLIVFSRQPDLKPIALRLPWVPEHHESALRVHVPPQGLSQFFPAADGTCQLTAEVFQKSK